MLQLRGVHYDVGHHYGGTGPGNTRLHFAPDAVRAEMKIIADQLHANTVRISGTDLSRLAIAVGLAREAGLAVWYSPFPGELSGDDVVSYLTDAAIAAEEMRLDSGEVTMVTGCELSLFCRGFLPGATLEDRLDVLTNDPLDPGLTASFGELPRALNATLGRSVAAVRAHFRGPVTYASAPWEAVDWNPFDLVSVDLYRDRGNATWYRDALRGYRRFGRPTVISEFGCCTYLGAADAGGAGFTVLDYDPQSSQWRLEADLERSEPEQSRYLQELLAIFDEEDVHGAFWHTFAGWDFPHRTEPQMDLDVGSFGLVKVVEMPRAGGEEFTLEPKDAFRALAAAYQQPGSR